MAASSLRLLTESYASSSSSSEEDDDDGTYGLLDDVERTRRTKHVSPRRKRTKVSESLPSRTAETKEPLPVLPSIRNLFESESIEESDTTQLRGRVRSFPHEIGNWSTYVYVPYEAGPVFLDLVSVLLRNCEGLSMFASDHFHVSVSRTVVFRYHWIKDLVSSLRKSLGDFEGFPVVLKYLEVYCNEERTRTFLGLKVLAGAEKLKRIVRVVDKLFADFKLASFYERPSFHMSVGWCVGDKANELEALLPKLQEVCEDYTAESEKCRSTVVNGLELKTGNKTFPIPFRNTLTT